MRNLQTSKFFLFVFFLLVSACCSSQKRSYTEKEKNSIKVFLEFTKYIHSCIVHKDNLSDSTHLKYLLFHFLFINKKIDTAKVNGINLDEIPKEQISVLIQELRVFFSYLQKKENEELIKNIDAVPLRLSRDTFLYNRFTRFQKENTIAFFDKRYPMQTLGYMLFLPAIKNKTTVPKIWSWTLMFKFGKYYFRAVTGEEGYEYMFSPSRITAEPIEHL